MNRPVLQAALGRASECCASTATATRNTLSSSWGTTVRPFSTSVPDYFQDSKNYNEGDKPPSLSGLSLGRQQRSAAAAQKLASLSSRPRLVQAPRPAAGKSASAAPGDGPRVIRPAVAGPFGSSSPQGPPRILNLRSLRGSFQGCTAGAGLRGGPAQAGGGSRLSLLGRRPPFAGAGGVGGRGRLGGAGRGGGRGRGGRGGAGRMQQKRKKKTEFAEGEGKLTWNAEEQAVWDRVEQGQVIPFVPELKLDSLAGYGPALATNAPIGKVGTVLRTMRMISGGHAFNSDAGVTVDAKALRRRYHHEKKPVFFNTMAEKEWAERAEPNWKVRAPSEATQKAILDLSVLGLYQETKPVPDLMNVPNVIANFHGRSWSYRTEDSQKFMDKVVSMLPEEMKTSPAPASPAKKK